jgi:hypothetical protein
MTSPSSNLSKTNLQRRASTGHLRWQTYPPPLRKGTSPILRRGCGDPIGEIDIVEIEIEIEIEEIEEDLEIGIGIEGRDRRGNIIRCLCLTSHLSRRMLEIWASTVERRTWVIG